MKVESFRIKSWKKKQTGVLVAENNKWILVNHILDDFILDGYKLYRKKFVKKRISGKKEQKIERVLNLKNYKITKFKKFKFNNVYDTLKWSENKYGLFEFQDSEENELFYGKINHTEKNELIIDFINSDRKVEESFDFKFSLKEIRSITFESNYFNAIKLLMHDEVNMTK